MKAIVLTFDKYKVFADHMIQSYMNLWPNNQFIFRIPYQDETVKTYFENKYNNKVEMIHSEPGIVDTVYTLLNDLDENEWVFWCMDDRYPISLNVDQLNILYEYITSSDTNDLSAMLFTSEPYCWSANNIYLSKYKIVSSSGQIYLRRKWYRMIWNHQYMKVGFIRYWFSHFPRKMKQAKIVDDNLLKMKLPDEYKLYMTKKNLGVYGESTSRGKITKNTIESFNKNNICLPENFEISDMYKVQGKSSMLKNMLYYCTYDLKCLLGIKNRKNH